MNDAADFLIAADHRIELALTCPVDQVDAVFLQCLEFSFRRLIGHAGRAADGAHRFEQFFIGDRIQFKYIASFRINLCQRQQQMLGRDEIVLQRAGFLLGRFENLAQRVADRRRPGGAAYFGQVVQLRLDNAIELPAVGADFFQQRFDNALVLGQQRGEQVQRLDLRIAMIGGQFLGALDGFLGFDGEFVESKSHKSGFRGQGSGVRIQ